jgi:GT2 family glycosyltransferase
LSEPTVSVIVPTFQRAEALRRTLAALLTLDYPEELLEIIVVDDGSCDSTPATVTTFPRVTYVRQSNSGVSVARNRGFWASSSDVLMFVDDDIVVQPDNVRQHLAVRAEYEECIVSGHSEFAPEIRTELERSPFGRFRLWTEDVAKAEQARQWGASGRIHPTTVATQNITIGREMFLRLDGFDERFPVGAEDQDLCWRAQALGCTIVHDYSIKVVHNDQHRDLLSLCRREERGAVGIVCLSKKHADFPAPEALALNGPIRSGDSPRVLARKIVRSTLSRSLPLWFAHRLVRLLEAVQPSGGRLLDFCYRGITGLYVFRGIRRGFYVTSRDPWRQAHRQREVRPRSRSAS